MSTTETPTPTPVHLAALAAALKSGDRPAVARIFAELADEFLAMTDLLPPGDLMWDLGRLHESLHFLATETGAGR